jgi:SAM-dependent methyltransferase
MAVSHTDIGARVLDVLRFAVPWDAAVAVVGPEVESIGRRIVVPLGSDAGDAAATARLEELRSDGIEYLVLGASASGWLDARPGLRRHLDSRYRLVDHEAEVCSVYALHDPPRRAGVDGLPLPPADMIRITSGLYRRASDPDALYRRYEVTGAETAGWVRETLARQGIAMEELASLLDFGCGCGRVARHWAGLPGRVHGSDYNPHLARWCAAHLTFGEFAANGAEPPLAYEDGAFDFLYSVSIFTHLDEPLQQPWIDELVRVVRPGGLLLITVSGETYARNLPGWERFRAAFERGALVVRKAERTGSNACAVLHPPAYVRETLARGLEIVDHEPGAAHAGRQDAWLLRTPAK